MAWYKTGTITVTNGSTTVSGAGTAWISNAAIGEALYAPDGKLYEITNIASDTTMTIAPAYLGATASAQAYVIVPSQSYIRDLAAQAADLVNNYSTIANNAGVGKFGDGTLGAPGIRFSDDLDTGFFRSASNEVTFVAGGTAIFKYNLTGGLQLSSVNLDGGTIDGTIIGGASAAAGTFTTATATTGNITTVNATTVDTTNIEVTNLKAKDGTAAGSIANSTGVVTLASSVLTTTDINGGTIDGTVIGGASAAAGSFTSLTDSGNLNFTGTGNRITGDFSNATISNRVAFQTSTVNSNTFIDAIPNGTAVTAGFEGYNNSDPTNSARARLFATTTEISVQSAITGTGTYLPMTFFTGGSEAMRITTNRDVGIGSTSPSGRLELSGSSCIRWQTTDASFINEISTNPAKNAYVGRTYDASSHVWKLSSSNAVTLDSSGNLLVGATTTAPADKGFTVTPSAGGSFINVGHINGTASGTSYATFAYNTGYIGSISQNGTTGVLYNLTSDYRLKNDPQPLTGSKDFIMALQPKKWQWWDGSGEGVGFIAHEFMEVAKYSGNGEKDAVDADNKPVYQSIQPSSSEVMANLIGLVQEQQAIITKLQADVAALKGN